MRKLILLFSLGILLVNCESKGVEKPKDLVGKDKMVDIWYDLYLINAMKSTELKFLQDRNITPASYIFEKYKVDSIQFGNSDRYYANDVELYDNLHKKVTTRLQKDKAAIDSTLLKNPEVEVKKEEKKPAEIPLKSREMLRKKHDLRGALFKDTIKN